MTDRNRTPATLLTLAHWWAVLLALCLLAAPLDSMAARAHAKAKPAASHAKAKAKPAASHARRAAKAAKRPAARHAVTAKKSRTGKARVAAQKRPAQHAAAAPAPMPIPADPGKLPLKASVAYVIDQESDEVLFGRNAQDVRPIASLTKLMTGMIISEAKLPMTESLTISDEDVDRLKHSSSRLKVGTEMTRAQALHLALMSSENRAAHALARTYPGGVSAFVSAMNNKARQLGMTHTRYVDPTGLSSQNRSSAHDLALLADAAYQQPLMRKYSTSRGYELAVGNGRELRYVNTNRLVREGEWNIGLQKTGYISEAGQCLVVQTKVKGRNLIMVFLDSATKFSRIRDAQLVRRWLREHVDFASHRGEPSAQNGNVEQRDSAG